MHLELKDLGARKSGDTLALGRHTWYSTGI